jgi:hypothetical protein
MYEAEDAGLTTMADHLKHFRHELLHGPDAFDKDSAEYFCSTILDMYLGSGATEDPPEETPDE